MCREQFAAGDRQHLPDDVVDVELGHLRPGFLGERPQTADHVRRAHAVLRDARKANPALRQDRVRPRVQEPQRGLALGHDGGERLIDLMSDRRAEFAHRGQPRHSLKVGARVPQRLLGKFALGDVDRDSGEDRRATGCRGTKGVDLRPDYAAILAPVSLLDMRCKGLARRIGRDDRLGSRLDRPRG